MADAWTRSQIALLGKLWNDDGLTASQCASVLGVTRNAVIGKVHRENYPKRKQTPKAARRGFTWSAEAKERARVRSAAARARKAKNDRPTIRIIPVPSEVFQPEVEDLAVGAWSALPDAMPISLLQVTDQTCRWPIGDDLPFSFCGCPVAPGSSYCPTHKHRSTGKGTTGEQLATRSAAVIARLEVKNGFRSHQAGQSL